MNPVVLVCGGRDYSDMQRVRDVLDDIAYQRFLVPITVLHGGASGADFLAAAWAQQNGFQVIGVPADWVAHGRAAGPRRNQSMLNDYKPDLVVAFPGGRGTEDMVLRAMRAGVEVLVVKP